MVQVAVYLRVSTSRQQQAQTIEQQLTRLQAHLATHPDWQLQEADIYRDDGYSGAKLNRPGLDALRDHARAARFTHVLVTAPDRLARNYVRVFGNCREKNCVIRHQEGLNWQFEPCIERAHWRISWMAS